MNVFGQLGLGSDKENQTFPKKIDLNGRGISIFNNIQIPRTNQLFNDFSKILAHLNHSNDKLVSFIFK